MVKLVNTDSQTIYWYAVPKFSLDIGQAVAKGVMQPHGEDSYDPETTIDVIFAFDKTKYAAACCAPVGSTVTFYNDYCSWCRPTQ